MAEGWKLFAVCVSAFLPTREFQNYLVNYFIDNYDSAVDEVRVLAPFCYYRIFKTLKEGPEPMKLADIEAILVCAAPSHPPLTCVLLLLLPLGLCCVVVVCVPLTNAMM